jgi:hypothetical protein
MSANGRRIKAQVFNWQRYDIGVGRMAASSSVAAVFAAKEAGGQVIGHTIVETDAPKLDSASPVCGMAHKGLIPAPFGVAA